MKLPQLWVAAVGQLPEEPLHTVTSVSVPVVQDAAPHVSPVLNESGGQVVSAPSQTSWTSQTPFAVRQGAPLFPAGATQPFVGSQLSAVHGLPSLHASAGPPAHAPPAQVSFVVQAFTSSHGAVLFVNTHPVAGTHVSSVQTLPSLQGSAAPPLQTPAAQVSFVVHAL